MLLPNSDTCIDLVGLSPGDLCTQSEHNRKSKPYLTELDTTFPKAGTL